MKKIIDKDSLLELLKNRKENEILDLKNCIFKDMELTGLDL